MSVNGEAKPATLRFERKGDVGIAHFANAAKMNPLTVDLQLALRDLLATVRADTSLRALVLTGEGRAFCVGADLAGMGPELGDKRSLGQWTADKMEELSNRLIQELRELPVPVVCALNGATAGAGVGLALAADVVVAARSSYFLLPFLPRLGIVPDLGTTWFLARLVGRARAVGVALLGERLPAEEAANWGLVWRCVDDASLLDEALGIATRLAALPAGAALEARQAFDAAETQGLVAQMRYEADRQRELIDRPAFMEGVRAFIEKREPVFPPRSE